LHRQQSLELLLILLALLSGMVRADTKSSPSPEASAGLEGSISLHTISGGPVRQGVPDSKPLANTTFVVRQEERVVTSFTTDAQGRFRVSLPPGHYSISKKDWQSRVGFFGPFPVDTVPGQTEKVQWNCDTGMQ